MFRHVWLSNKNKGLQSGMVLAMSLKDKVATSMSSEDDFNQNTQQDIRGLAVSGEENRQGA